MHPFSECSRCETSTKTPKWNLSRCMTQEFFGAHGTKFPAQKVFEQLWSRIGNSDVVVVVIEK